MLLGVCLLVVMVVTAYHQATDLVDQEAKSSKQVVSKVHISASKEINKEKGPTDHIDCLKKRACTVTQPNESAKTFTLL